MAKEVPAPQPGPGQIGDLLVAGRGHRHHWRLAGAHRVLHQQRHLLLPVEVDQELGQVRGGGFVVAAGLTGIDELGALSVADGIGTIQRLATAYGAEIGIDRGGLHRQSRSLPGLDAAFHGGHDQRHDQRHRDETDHLAWTLQRLDELGARPSLLNPLWYAGAFSLGLLAGRFAAAATPWPRTRASGKRSPAGKTS